MLLDVKGVGMCLITSLNTARGHELTKSPLWLHYCMHVPVPGAGSLQRNLVPRYVKINVMPTSLQRRSKPKKLNGRVVKTINWSLFYSRCKLRNGPIGKTSSNKQISSSLLAMAHHGRFIESPWCHSCCWSPLTYRGTSCTAPAPPVPQHFWHCAAIWSLWWSDWRPGEKSKRISTNLGWRFGKKSKQNSNESDLKISKGTISLNKTPTVDILCFDCARILYVGL